MEQQKYRPIHFMKVGLAVLLQTVLLSLTCFSSSLSAQTDPNLVGTWKTPVFFSKHYHVQMEHQFAADGSTKFTLSLYSALPYQATGKISERTGSYQIIGPSPSGANIYEIDIKIEDVFFTMLDPDTVALANDNGETCSTGSPWKVAEKKLVTGQVCMEEYVAKRGDVEKLVFQLEDDKLYWGFYWGSQAVFARDARSPEARNLILNKDIYFRKQ